MIQIDNETYNVRDCNRYSSITKKTQIVIASSLRKDSNHIVRLLHKDYGKTKRWNTFTISRDGTIYQHYNPNNYSDFLNIKAADKQSISIVLENMGYLKKDNSGNFVNWLNEDCENDYVVEYRWLDLNYWEMYSDKQMESCINLCDYLCDEFEIKRKVMLINTYHKDTIKFNGIVFRSNYIENVADINPTFQTNQLVEHIVES